MANNTFVVLAEFDIDKGSTVRFQVPEPITERAVGPKITQERLAEQMLPDGSHNYENDWTAFFLNRKPVVQEIPQPTTGPQHVVAFSRIENQWSLIPGAGHYVRVTRPSDEAVEPEVLVCDSDDNYLVTLPISSSLEFFVDEEVVPSPNRKKKTTTSNDTVEGGNDTTTDDKEEKENSQQVDVKETQEQQTTSRGDTSSAETTETDVDSGTNQELPDGGAEEGKEPEKKGDDKGLDKEAEHNPIPPPTGEEDPNTAKGTTEDSQQGITTSHTPTSSKDKTEEGDSVVTVHSLVLCAEGKNTPSCSDIKLRFSNLEGINEFIHSLTTIKAEEATKVNNTSNTKSTATPETSPPDPHDGDILRCVNFVSTKKDKSQRRGAVVKAVACCTTNWWPIMFQPLLMKAMDEIMKANELEVSEKIITELHQAVSTIQFHPHPQIQCKVWRSTTNEFQKLQHKQKCAFMGDEIELTLTTGLDYDDIGLPGVSLVALIRKFKEATMTIWGAILATQRVVFLGKQMRPGQLVRYVLSSVFLVCPHLEGIIDQRVFPYASLADLSFLEMPGYIAGVTNPMFEQRDSWWDVFCDIDTGTVKINPKLQAANFSQKMTEVLAPTSSAATTHTNIFDSHALIGKVIAMIDQNNRTTAKSSQWLEVTVRDTLTEHLEQILTHPLFEADDDKGNNRTKLESQICALRWLLTSVKANQKNRCSTQCEGVTKSCAMCRQLKYFDGEWEEPDLLELLKALIQNAQASEESALEILAQFPSCQLGLYSIAKFLFHPSLVARRNVVLLLQKLETLQQGRAAISSLNPFLLFTYSRLQTNP